MTNEKDDLLAFTVGAWLQSKGCVVTLTQSLKKPGWLVNYTLPEDLKPQPPVEVSRGSITFPEGSQEDLILTFLLGQ